MPIVTTYRCRLRTPGEFEMAVVFRSIHFSDGELTADGNGADLVLRIADFPCILKHRDSAAGKRLGDSAPTLLSALQR
jgi:hypothetical protein